MRINLYSILFCSFAVFAIGSGIGRIPAAAAAPITRVETVRSPTGVDRAEIKVLPRVVVIADGGVGAGADTDLLDRSVMLDAAVGQARQALAKRVGTGVRRVSLGLPYYAFGRLAARRTE
jgi:hypothetical protein